MGSEYSAHPTSARREDPLRVAVVSNGNALATYMLRPLFVLNGVQLVAAVIVPVPPGTGKPWQRLWRLSSRTGIRYSSEKLALEGVARAIWFLDRSPVLLAQACGAAGVPAVSLDSANSTAAGEFLESAQPDVVVSVSTPHRLKPRILEVARVASINLHWSLLPAYAGIAPYFWALRNGETRAGVTVHVMDRELDAGPILGQRALEIRADESVLGVQLRLARLGRAELVANLVELETRLETARGQDRAQRSYFSWPRGPDVRALRRRGRALSHPADLREATRMMRSRTPLPARRPSSSPLRIAYVSTIDLTLRFILIEHLRALRDAGHEVTAISAPGPWVASIEQAGVRWLPWPNASRSWSLRRDTRAAVELYRLLRRERFDLVHTHTPKAAAIGRIAARAAGARAVVNTTHGLYATPESPLVRRLAVLTVEGLASRFSDLELFVSQEDVAWVRRLHLMPASKARWIGNGIDLNHFDPAAVPPERVADLREELGIGPKDRVVGYVGRFAVEKGFRDFVDAAVAISRTTRDVRFLAVGEADSVRSIGVSEAAVSRAPIIATGWRTDVRDLLAVMDVLVAPSHREGLPLAPIEAGAMGKAMVLTDIRGCREVAHHQREALLVAPRDHSALVQAISALVDDEPARQQLGRAARAHIRSSFDQQVVIARLLSAYEQALSCRPGRALYRADRGT